MAWKTHLRWLLVAYRTSSPLIRRKAELSLLVWALLGAIFVGNLIQSLLLEGPSWPVALRSLVTAAVMVLGVGFLVRGRLEIQVNTLTILCFFQCLVFFNAPISRQFFVLSVFSLVAFAILALRPYQTAMAFGLFPGLVLAKGGWEFFQWTQGMRTQDALPDLVFTLLVFAAIVPLVHELWQVVGREIRHNEILLGVNRALKKEAGTDQLTGTWNRRHFDPLAKKMTGEALRTGRPLALGILDLDRFKQVNDVWGHLTGDEALGTVVRVVLGVLRQGDSLIRWGGDEFVVLCPGVGSGDAPALGQKILDAVRTDPSLLGWNLGISVGLAIWRPGEPVTTLLDRADRLLYQAKEEGRNRFCSEKED